MELWPLGGFSRFGPTSGGPIDDFWIALAGPFSNLLQGMGWLALYSVTSLGDFSGLSDAVNMQKLETGSFGAFVLQLFGQAVFLNLVLLVLNLLIPAHPLNGAKLMSSLMVHFNFSIPFVAKVTAISGLCVGGTMFVYGLYDFFGPRGSYGVMLAIIGGFTLNSGWALWRLYTSGHINEHPLFSRQCHRVVFANGHHDAGTPIDDDEELEVELT